MTTSLLHCCPRPLDRLAAATTPYCQYNATARIVPPVHLLGHLIIKVAFVGLYHCSSINSAQSRPSYFGTTRYVDRWRYRSSGMAGRYNCLPVALSDGRRRRPLVMAVLATAVFTGYYLLLRGNDGPLPLFCGLILHRLPHLPRLPPYHPTLSS